METSKITSLLAAIPVRPQKLGKIGRIVSLVSGSVLLYRAIRKKSVKKGFGAGYLLAQGVSGKRLKVGL